MDLGVIRPGDALIWGQACAEPQTLVEALIAQRAALSGCRVFLGSSYSGLVRAEHADHLRFASYCGTGSNRALAEAGALQILPSPYSQLGALIRGGRIGCDVALVQVSPPNARGEFSIGALPNTILRALAGRDLLYHSGVVCDAVRLVQPKRCVGGALMGTQALFDWARDNST